jgi:hypothetical protein
MGTVSRAAARFGSGSGSGIGIGMGLSVLAGAAGAMLFASDARADEPKFQRFDVETVFYISKSDDHNRVDFGIRLDERCVPKNDDAVFQYWREFEKAPPVRTHGLGAFDFIAYGISEQRVLRKTPTGAVHFIRLRQFPKTPIDIVTKLEADGHCSTQALWTINGKESGLTYVFVQLAKGGIFPSVDFVDVHGRDLETGHEVTERLRR